VKTACIGDINRQEEQFKRSGGTVCFINNENVWAQYHQLVSDIEACSHGKPKVVATTLFGKVKKVFEGIKEKFVSFISRFSA
jgi:hypothetical protein